MFGCKKQGCLSSFAYNMKRNILCLHTGNILNKRVKDKYLTEFS